MSPAPAENLLSHQGASCPLQGPLRPEKSDYQTLRTLSLKDQGCSEAELRTQGVHSKAPGDPRRRLGPGGVLPCCEGTQRPLAGEALRVAAISPQWRGGGLPWAAWCPRPRELARLRLVPVLWGQGSNSNSPPSASSLILHPDPRPWSTLSKARGSPGGLVTLIRALPTMRPVDWPRVSTASQQQSHQPGEARHPRQEEHAPSFHKPAVLSVQIHHSLKPEQSRQLGPPLSNTLSQESGFDRMRPHALSPVHLQPTPRSRQSQAVSLQQPGRWAESGPC